MKYLNFDEVILIHDLIIKETGGLIGFNKNSIGYLESALNQIKIDDFYPSFSDKLTHLMFACIKFHPFNDGNKRSSIFIGMHFLLINNKTIKDFAIKFEDIVVDVAEDKISKEELKQLIEKFLEIKNDK
ncbi:type II toxin-antitoxin system death-on-curing family toxin [Campylobacter peloridis]|uniref:Type II toxin-antitoxin system death-on-curing family toxin n=1 Tax=Campylobacter peloridis TaxID=488546 RepID=A0A5C7DYV5_9BACT|nr:type II toxin-antitoxin system death-on-curing family toxin [Campylobacter peloridis]AJC84140.1 Fic/DOC family protein [Campylobacter peloridis LMG 23910]MBX2078952.1 type II toxin-antitoxin system death-on-curing family toxin [Campylobacter peloridis]QOQ88243.1 type II toxin-antitoxin system death-on-curing family toxin [Campylobacter peloridis]TXE83673.1 type II toxin-antitoxin system death-on-curing family toxin [Campylobacter peloridis]